MSSDYYTLEKAAEVLGLPTAEINRLREKSLLRAFRDGASWKFRKVDVDNYLADMIRNRNKASDPDAAMAGDSDFDLLSMDDDDGEEMPTLLADSASFDSLMEDGIALGDEMVDAAPAFSQDVSASQNPPSLAKNASDTKDDLSLADDDLMLADDDGLSLAGDSGLSLLDVGQDDKNDADKGINLTKNSPQPAAPSPASSDVDLALDDDLVLDEGGSSAQLDLAGDSGLSLMDIADDVELQPADQGGSDIMLELSDDDDILSLADDDDVLPENTNTIAIPVEEDFQLTPESHPGAFGADDSDSSSQIIALDEDSSEENEFGETTELGAEDIFSGPGVASPFMPADNGAASAMPDAGDAFMGGAATAGAAASPFGGGATDGEFVSSTPAFAAAPAPVEANYSPMLVACLVIVAGLLVLPGMMLVDLIMHIWSWDEPFVVNSTLMDLICGMVGLK